MRPLIGICLLAMLPFAAVAAETGHSIPTRTALDAEAAAAMKAAQANGLAIAVIDAGKVVHVAAYGQRNAKGDPLQTATVMYGASLTKAVFAYTVLQLVDEGRLDLDRPIATYFDTPLTDYPAEDAYGPWPDLAGDERWKAITARHLLTHSSGFANFAYLEPDEKLRIHFAPGSRYAYSGEGLILLQYVIERGLGLDLGQEMQQRVFDRFGMPNTSMIWRPDFATNLADGWMEDGAVEPHDERSRVRAAGSMDTTIADLANFAAALSRGEGLSPASAAAMATAQLPITTASQFPTLQDELPAAKRRRDLAAGLGVVVFDGPQGAGFYKGGHNDSTGNTFVCVRQRQRCVVILGNDVRAERAFPRLVAFVLGETGVPWTWEYGNKQFVP
ncbi:CubicO group peptidase, beta-lactamase class C family [Pseudoxanthomonas sp. CF385]|uniref:serine hydrolase domain-containing protein n=1 Tax=Pseudoxanthomonas sp. CF385 TaxID=1881042 RepID=UPI0008898F84|nr:serine hydrolase domain-containing protein [Pseudoxanthomonas sp. CF385]SDR12212.1 CubicO group peptidase, beta-lactamase class C family [Pseudoxanthomonas sp. CF385]